MSERMFWSLRTKKKNVNCENGCFQCRTAFVVVRTVDGLSVGSAEGSDRPVET